MLVGADPYNKPDKDFHCGNTGSIPVRDALDTQPLTPASAINAFGGSCFRTLHVPFKDEAFAHTS